MRSWVPTVPARSATGAASQHQETNGAPVVRPIDFFYDPQKKNELENVHPYYNGGIEGHGRTTSPLA